jgi:alkane 1-monooxygenase
MTGNLRNILYLLSLSPSILVIVGNLNGGIFTLSNLVYSLIFRAIIEWITPAFLSNKHTKKTDIIPQFIILLHIPVQVISLGSLFWGIQQNIIQGPWIFCAALSTGLTSGTSAIVISHELIHQKSKAYQALGRFLLFTAGNIYFFIEHLKVHHKWVATSKDHSTAKLGESIYAFFVRSTVGQIKGAYSLEKERLTKENAYHISLENYVVRQICLQVLVLAILFITLGIYGPLAWLTQAFFANFLLEYVNYIQHYGLVRDEKQRQSDEHSWDSEQFVSRFILVDLSRHADHHTYASKPYHTLAHSEKSPKLPSGYAGLFFIAAIPALWRKVMDVRLKIVK